MARVVWIVSEGSPGHVSQTVGLAQALAAQIPLRIERVECRPRLNGVARSLVRAWMGAKGRALPDAVLRRWLQVDLSTVPAGGPDLILSSGGKSVFAARTLSAKHGVPYVFLGERKPYRSEWFHTVFTPSGAETGVNDVAIETIPTQIDAARVEAAAKAWTEKPEGRLWTMVVGGGSVSHRYADDDWKNLADGMNELARREGVRWLVTTSRRTGARPEALLRAGLAPEALAGAVWWAERPEKRMSAYLGAAERVVVTQDSVTMVSEAIASGRPVVVVRPDHVAFPRGSFMPGYFERLEAAGRIVRVAISDLGTSAIGDARFRVKREPVEVELVRVLLGRLGWGANSSS